MFIAPKRIKNSFLFKSPVTSLPITAACPAPNPGRKETNGDAISEAMRALIKDFFLTFTFLNLKVLCLGIFCFFIMEVIRAEEPKRPVRRGRRGSFMFKLKTESPKNPAKMKIIAAQALDFLSK